MKAYLITTGSVFAILVVAHLWRIVAESRHLATEPDFILVTLAAGALSAWAWRLLWRYKAS